MSSSSSSLSHSRFSDVFGLLLRSEIYRLDFQIEVADVLRSEDGRRLGAGSAGVACCTEAVVAGIGAW